MKKAIVLCHGLFMNRIVMMYLKKNLEKKGYKVYNYGYKTTKYDERTLYKMNKYIKKIKEDDITFVGHSMGGLLIHNYLKEYEKPENKRYKVITLGTPHNGSEVASCINHSKLKWMLGTSTKASLEDGLIGWKFKDIPLGCIVGTINFGVLNLLGKFKAKSDGTVFYSEAINPDCTDYVDVATSHTGLIYSNIVVEQIDGFIKENKFI